MDGGETKLANLVLLCRRHHRFVHEHDFRIELSGEQIRFVRPDGSVVPNAPKPTPQEADHGWIALTRAHAQLGLHIGPRTSTPHWMGEAMDYDLAIGALQRRAGR